MSHNPKLVFPAVVLSIAVAIFAANSVQAQQMQYKIEADGTVLKLKRVNVTTFVYAPFAKAELRRDGDGKAVWYFKAETGKEYTAPAPNQPPAPVKYTAVQLNAALTMARNRGEIPTAASVELERGVPMFLVKFERNSLQLRWHAQVGMSAEEYEVVNRSLAQQGYVQLFAQPYTDSDRSTRFFAAWRR